MTADLVSRVELAAMLAVSPQRVHQLVRHPDFPAPVAKLGIGEVWELSAIEKWMRKTGRLAPGEPLIRPDRPEDLS